MAWDQSKHWDEVLTDVIFLVSFLVLGGNFREKFHALFVREACRLDNG